MIPSIAELALACEYLARRFDWELKPWDRRLLQALADRREEALARHPAPQDEPAALFFAFSHDTDVLGEDYGQLAMTLSKNNARSQGLELRASRFELIDLARSISGRVASYDDVCAWFAERLTPRR